MVKDAPAILSSDDSAREAGNSLVQTGIGDLVSKNMGWRPAHIRELQFVPHVDSVEYLFITQRHPTAPYRTTPNAKVGANRNEFGYDPRPFSIYQCIGTGFGGDGILACGFGIEFGEIRIFTRSFSSGAGGLGVIFRSSHEALKVRSVLRHDFGLRLHDLRLSPEHQQLKGTNYDQESVESPDTPIRPVLRYRDAGKFAHFDGLLCIFRLCRATDVLLIGYACPGGSRRLSGWSLIVLGFPCDSLARGGRAIERLRVDWGRRLCDGEQRSQDQAYHNGVIVTVMI